ncbi:hypothetical protein KAU11_04380 [Candidatus Babeliales bacterium]|nr:hypothetical protein [Candidatus Babeliales bacterium]
MFKNYLKKLLLTLICFSSTISCTAQDDPKQVPFSPPKLNLKKRSARRTRQAPTMPRPQISKTQTPSPTAPRPTQDELSQPATTEVNEENGNIFLNFDNVSLASIVDHLAEQKKINVIPHKDLANTKVSLHTNEPFSLTRAWNIMLTLLEMHGFSIIDVGGIHRIVSNKDNMSEPLPIYSSANGVKPKDLPETDKVIRYIYFLHNIKAEMAASILNKMLDNPVQIQGDLDVCIIKEKSLSIKSAMKVIEELDEGGLRQSIKMLPIHYTDPDTVARLFQNELAPQKGRGKERVRFVTTQKKEVNHFSSDVKIIPNSQRGVVFLLGTEIDLKPYVEFIKKYLDVPMDDAESRIHVREVLYYDAEQLKRIVNQVIRPPQGTKSGDFGYFEDVVITAESPKSGPYDNFGSGNRLIIACNKDDWVRLEKIIDRVDKPQPQITLEVMIVDVSLDMTKKLSAHLRDTGVGVFGTDTAFRLANIYNVPAGDIGSSSLREDSMHNILDSVKGETTTKSSVLTLGSHTEGEKSGAWGIIRTLLDQDNANIISQPFQVVNNRERCEIVSTQKSRVEGELKHSYADKLLQNKVDVNAKTSAVITPRVNNAGIIDLTIEIRVEDFKDRTASHPTINSRSLNTRVSMGVGEVLVLGGLTRSKHAENQYKTPILSSVPIFGNFFKSKQKRIDKKHLYIFIRPTIIKPQFEGRADDYTQFKLDYAKHQIFKVENYSKSKDPIQRFFFKPRNHSIQETMDDIKSRRFHYIDDFVEKKYMPPTADMRRDPYYRARETLGKRTKLAKAGTKRALKNMKRRKKA